MSTYALDRAMGSLGGLIGTFGSYIIASLLSTFILTLGIRWFIFHKAGEKGWKAIIPFYSDYIYYRIAWDGRIYVMLLVASIIGAIIGAIFGLIHPVLGTVLAVICNTAVAGANAIAGMILQFKMARAFGRNDYFAIGLYFLSPIFSAILAFGDAKYKGRQDEDGIGVPQFVDDLGNRATAAAAHAASAAAQQLQNQAQRRPPVQPAPQQPVPQQPMQPQYPQYPQQGYPQQEYPRQTYQAAPPQQGYPQPGEGQPPVQRSRRSMHNPEA